MSSNTTRGNARTFARQNYTGQDPEPNPLAGLETLTLDEAAGKAFDARAKLRDEVVAIQANQDLTAEAKARKIKALEDDHNAQMFALDAERAEKRHAELAQVQRSLFEPKGIDGSDYRGEVRRLSSLDSEGLLRAMKLAAASGDKVTLRAILTVADQTDDSIVMEQLLNGPLADVAGEYQRYADLLHGGGGTVFDGAIRL